MPIKTCECCCRDVNWIWEDAFDKFGYNDGDGLVMTGEVSKVLREVGYTVDDAQWGLHNTLIISLKCPSRGELMPETGSGHAIGYSNPRDYLPADVIALLDRELPA